MNRRRGTLARSWAVLPSLLIPRRAEAQGGSELIGLDGGLFIWTILSFVIVLIILTRVAWPRILGTLETREKMVRESLEGAARERAQAAALLQEARVERENSRKQAKAAIEQAREVATQVRKEILEETQREREAILNRARGELKRAEGLRSELESRSGRRFDAHEGEGS